MATEFALRAEVFHLLAEALTEPPLWMAGAGSDWPLFAALARASRHLDSEAARQAAQTVSAIPPESLPARRQRHHRLFAGPGRPNLWLYESAYADGRIFGPTALDVERVYRAAGVEPEGAERPDHASVELAFVGWLFEQAAADPAAGWQKLARRFIEVHAGRWLPQVGQSLAATGDPVYASIGQLLSGWLAEAAAAPRPKRKAGASLPAVPRPQACTLCGFCVRVCPTGALLIRETERETGLILNPAACIACGKCERVCEFDALRMTSPKTPAQEAVALRVSPRPPCPHCGAPTVSAAELDAVAAYLGRRPAWLDYCLNCRPQFMKG